MSLANFSVFLLPFSQILVEKIPAMKEEKQNKQKRQFSEMATINDYILFHKSLDDKCKQK